MARLAGGVVRLDRAGVVLRRQRLVDIPVDRPAGELAPEHRANAHRVVAVGALHAAGGLHRPALSTRSPVALASCGHSRGGRDRCGLRQNHGRARHLRVADGLLDLLADQHAGAAVLRLRCDRRGRPRPRVLPSEPRARTARSAAGRNATAAPQRSAAAAFPLQHAEHDCRDRARRCRQGRPHDHELERPVAPGARARRDAGDSARSRARPPGAIPRHPDGCASATACR